MAILRGRMRPQLLLLALIVAALLVQQSAAQQDGNAPARNEDVRAGGNNNQDDTPAPAEDDGGGAGGQQDGKNAAAREEDSKTSGGNNKDDTPGRDGGNNQEIDEDKDGKAAQDDKDDNAEGKQGDNPPEPPRRNRKRPPPPAQDVEPPTPVPAPVPEPIPAPPPPVINPEDTMKLILKIAGASYPLSDDQLQAVVRSLNNYTAPVEFSWRWQQASAPDGQPQVANSVVIYPPPPPPAEQPNNDNSNGNDRNDDNNGNGSGNNNDNGGGNSNGNGNDNDREGNGGGNDREQERERDREENNNQNQGGNNQGDNDGGNQRRLHRLLLVAGVRRGLQQAETASGVVQWWPEVEVPRPLTSDGVYVFADAQATPVQQPGAMINLKAATTQGLLCNTLNSNGVPCTAAIIAAEGIGTDRISVFAGANAEDDMVTTSSSGFSTAALVGICVGAAVAVAIVAMVAYLFVGWRRERRITRAATQRTKSRRVEVQPDEESKWRQMYSARMVDSMRRAEDTAMRQQAQSKGPSFVEAQDRAFAAQATAADRQLTTQMSSKKSFRRGTPQTPATELSSGTRLDMESPDQSLMTGSELSSPSPSLSNSGRTTSLKRLFGGGGSK